MCLSLQATLTTQDSFETFIFSPCCEKSPVLKEYLKSNISRLYYKTLQVPHFIAFLKNKNIYPTLEGALNSILKHFEVFMLKFTSNDNRKHNQHTYFSFS